MRDVRALDDAAERGAIALALGDLHEVLPEARSIRNADRPDSVVANEVPRLPPAVVKADDGDLLVEEAVERDVNVVRLAGRQALDRELLPELGVVVSAAARGDLHAVE